MASDVNYRPNPASLRSSQGAPTAESLVSVLFAATSPQVYRLEQATAYLSELEVHPVFWVLLLDIAFERNVRIDADWLRQESANGTASTSKIATDEISQRWTAIRIVAIIRFKNGTEKYWRSRVVNRVTITIPAETKQRLRQTLLRCLDEPERTVALQASVAIARIARLDFPTQWPDLFTNLQQAMVAAHGNLANASQASAGQLEDNRLILLRAADVCQRVLKEFSTVRILAGKIRITELARQLLPDFVPMLQQYFLETFFNVGAGWQQWAQTPHLAQRIRTSHLLLKSVTHLAAADMGTLTSRSTSGDGQTSNLAQEFFRMTPQWLQMIRDARSALLQVSETITDGQEVLSAILKHYLAFGKMYLAMVLRDNSKAVAWQGWDEVVWWYWQQSREASEDRASLTSKSADTALESTRLHPAKFIVQSLLMMKHSLQAWEKTRNLPAVLGDTSIVQQMADVLVDKLMLLTQEDLEIWNLDPEDWSVAEEAEVYDVDVRPAAERTLMMLAKVVKPQHTVGDIIWAKYKSICSRPTQGILDEVLRRDAVYAALGRCRDYLPCSAEEFADTIAHRLVPEASLEAGAMPTLVILRRRIVWLLWEWSEKIATKDRPAVYQLMASLLADLPDQTDVAVRLAAARCVGALADAIEFDSEAFQPYIDVTLTRLAQLAAASDLHEMDSVRTCTTAMSILIERLGPRVAPYLTSLAGLIPTLWTIEDPNYKAKPGIITFVGKLVRSIELLEQSSVDALHSVIEVIVRDSLQPDNSAMLGKDALELWIRAVRSSTRMTDPLFRLLDLLPTLFAQPDYCPEACRVGQESTLLAPHQVMTVYGATLMVEFAKIVGDPMSPLILHPITAIDVIMQALHAQNIPPQAWAQLLNESGLFYALLGSVIKVNDSTIVSGYFVALLARLCYMANGTNVYSDLIQSAAYRLEGPACQVYSQVVAPMISQWCKLFENMASSRKRKITCLGLAALLADGASEKETALICHSLPDMIGVWMDMFGDLREDDSGGPPIVPKAPPSSPLAIQRQRSLSGVARRSPSPALSIPGLEGLDDDTEWLEDTSPGRARMLELNRVDPVNTVKLTSFVSLSLNQAQQRYGGTFTAALAKMDAVVVDLLQSDLK